MPKDEIMEHCEDAISRKAAINALWKALYEYEDKTEKQFQESDELNISDWISHRLFIQNMSDIDRNVIQNLPSVTPHYTDAEIQKMQEMEQAEIQKAYELGKTSQPKTGQWIKHDTGHSIYYDCSRCSCIAPCTETADKWLWKLSNYCPDCGAKMINFRI